VTLAGDDGRAQEPATFTRDSVTIVGYGALITFGWFLYAMGPTIPLLQGEQGTSRTVASLHSVAFALGLLVAGLVTARLVARMGRGGTIRLGLGAMTAGVAILVVGSLPDGGTVPVTVASALVAGAGAPLVSNGGNAVVADHHGAAGAAALAEVNAAAVAVGLLAPGAVGVAVATGLTWRAAIAVFFPLAAVTWWLTRRASGFVALQPPSRPDVGSDGHDGRSLPAPFWLLWAALVACIMVESALITWTPDLLSRQVGLGAGSASASTTAFLAGMAAGRLLLSRLSLRWPTRTLLAACLVIAVAGWLVLWLSPVVWPALAGLVVAGFGAAGHFPLGTVLLIAASDATADRALGTLAVGIGVAGGAGPFLLAATADRFGIHTAFVLVPLCLAVAMTGLGLAARLGTGAGPQVASSSSRRG
jgi:MFS family permease